MREEEWGRYAIFIWLSAYMVFFIGGCVLLQKKVTIPRILIFTGTLFLLLVNLAMLVVYWEMFDMKYLPIYEDPTFHGSMGDGPIYPEWQRYFYWVTILLDVLGKVLAGAGLIAEGRQQIAILRYREMQRYQAQIHPTP